MDPTTIDQDVLTLEKAIDGFRGRTNDGVREIATRDLVNDMRKSHNTGSIPDQFLPADYLPKLAQTAREQLDKEERAESAELGKTLPALRARVIDAIARDRVLQTEAARVSVETNHAAWVNAKLLDRIDEQAAEAWLDKHEGDDAAILKRYAASDDRQDGGFVRLVEVRYGRTRESRTEGEKHVTDSVVSPLIKAVRERQEARVRPELRKALERIDAAQDHYVFAKGLLRPTDQNLAGAINVVTRRSR